VPLLRSVYDSRLFPWGNDLQTAPHWRGEIAATLTLAWPLVLGQLASIAMNVVDTLLAGRHGPQTLAGVAVGSAVWSLVLLVLIGVLMAIPPSVSQLAGAGQRARIGPLFRQAVWLALSMGLVLMLLVRQADWLLRALGIADDVRPPAEAFLQAVSWGAPALALHFCFRFLSEGVALTRPSLVSGVAGLLLLGPLGYWLMFGGAGLPGLGAAGLGWATAIVLWGQALGFGLFLARGRRYQDLGLFRRFEWPNPALLAELLRIGLPMGVSIFMEGSLFVATGLLIGTLGATAVAAHQIALNVASVCFMVPLGIAMAMTVRVGHAAGAGNASGVRWAGRAGYAIVAVTQVSMALTLALGAEAIAGAYTTDVAIAALAAQLLWLAAIFQCSDGLQAASAGALRGLKDTRVPMWITMLSYWGIGMSLGAWLGLYRGHGPAGMWLGLIAGLSAAALLLTLRFLRLARSFQPHPGQGADVVGAHQP